MLRLLFSAVWAGFGFLLISHSASAHDGIYAKLKEREFYKKVSITLNNKQVRLKGNHLDMMLYSPCEIDKQFVGAGCGPYFILKTQPSLIDVRGRFSSSFICKWSRSFDSLKRVADCSAGDGELLKLRVMRSAKSLKLSLVELSIDSTPADGLTIGDGGEGQVILKLGTGQVARGKLEFGKYFACKWHGEKCEPR